VVFFGIPLWSACGAKSVLSTRSASNASAKDTNPTIAIVPEFAPTESVLIQEQTLFDRSPALHGTVEIAEGILKAGVNLHVIEDAEHPFNKGAPDYFKKLQTLKQKYANKIHFFPQPLGNKKEWLRDFGPITARTADGKKLFIDFGYYAGFPVEDAFPSAFGKAQQTQVFKSPIKIEGGNFMIDEHRTCVVSTKAKVDNQTLDLTIPPYNCRQVVVLKPLSYEQTGHIDLFVKFLGQKIILVGDFSQDQASRVRPETNFDASAFASHLKEVQETFTGLGYQVVKVPMPVPYTVKYNENTGLDSVQLKEVHIRSYLNSLLLNRDGRQIALVPRFEKQKIQRNNAAQKDVQNDDSLPQDLGSIDYPDQDLILGYESTVRNAYKKAGYEVDFIPSDHLVASKGAVHCLTMQIPKVGP
jgi:agmatine/peptidylarginine deiminase